MASISQYIFEEMRIASYKNWPFPEDGKCSIRKMAEAGFFHTGTPDEPDAVQCFLCGKELDGWENDDNPWEQSHNAGCAFKAKGKPQAQLTKMDILKFIEMLAGKKINDAYDEDAKVYKQQFQDCIDVIKLRRKNANKNSEMWSPQKRALKTSN